MANDLPSGGMLARVTTFARNASYSDVALAFVVVAIVGLMILPLPTAVVDLLLGLSISIAVGLLLIALYIPGPTAFPSFPSVLLIVTLFRLALAITTTRLILLNADAGHIVETFGKLVVGGNLIVGIVVFLIITVVQFIVVAKGAERVAEVAARFTLDAMPGKQLSIDSDLRSGLIDKEEAKRRRRYLELESQLHGSLDGAMKFVKGDAVAGIVIIIVNILGGLGVGMLQRDMRFADALNTYAVLTVGEGLVMQIPALLAAIASGLIVTRTVGDERDRHLGEAITRQVTSQPRVLMITGCVALIIMWVPGFPKGVFLILGSLALVAGLLLSRRDWLQKVQTWLPGGEAAKEEKAPETAAMPEFALSVPVLIDVAEANRADVDENQLKAELAQIRHDLYGELGVLVPAAHVRFNTQLERDSYCVFLFEIPSNIGRLRPGHVFLKQAVPQESAAEIATEAGDRFLADYDTLWASESLVPRLDQLGLGYLRAPAQIALHAHAVLRRHAGQFLGIQEVNFLITKMQADYPDLIKETLRAVPLQRVSDVVRRLVEEGVSIRNLRDIFESLSEWGTREKDVVLLAEYARMGLKRYLSNKHAGVDRVLQAYLFHPELEEKFKQSVRVTNAGSYLALDPELAARVLATLRANLPQDVGRLLVRPVLLVTMEIRRYVRKLVENEFFELPVLSYQELSPEIQVLPMGQINA
jgi:type III secretion protein V